MDLRDNPIDRALKQAIDDWSQIKWIRFTFIFFCFITGIYFCFISWAAMISSKMSISGMIAGTIFALSGSYLLYNAVVWIFKTKWDKK